MSSDFIDDVANKALESALSEMNSTSTWLVSISSSATAALFFLLAKKEELYKADLALFAAMVFFGLSAHLTIISRLKLAKSHTHNFLALSLRQESITNEVLGKKYFSRSNKFIFCAYLCLIFGVISGVFWVALKFYSMNTI